MVVNFTMQLLEYHQSPSLQYLSGGLNSTATVVDEAYYNIHYHNKETLGMDTLSVQAII